MTTENLQQQSNHLQQSSNPQQQNNQNSKRRRKVTLTLGKDEMSQADRSALLSDERCSRVGRVLHETIIRYYRHHQGPQGEAFFELEKINEEKLESGRDGPNEHPKNDQPDCQRRKRRKNGNKVTSGLTSGANRKLVIHCQGNPTITSLTSSNNTVDLSPGEARLIEEATSASAACFIDESTLPVVGEIGSLGEAFNAYSHYVRRIVGYCNRVEAFKSMKRADQLALLKPFYFELLAIRFSYLYDAALDGYPVIKV